MQFNVLPTLHLDSRSTSALSLIKRWSTLVLRAAAFVLTVLCSIYNVEVNGGLTSLYQVALNYSHFNMYKQLDTPQYTDNSTVYR